MLEPSQKQDITHLALTPKNSPAGWRGCGGLFAFEQLLLAELEGIELIVSALQVQ